MRRSSSIEEKARDVLVDFLLAARRRPLAAFLDLYFPEGVPLAFCEPADLRVDTEVQTNLRSRVDIAIRANRTLLFIEVKVDAVEQVGQYEKYKHYFESEGYKVTAGGLINRTQRSTRKDNDAFLRSLGVRRLRWSQVLRSFEQQFGGEAEFRSFRRALSTLDENIGSPDAVPETHLPEPERTLESLRSSNAALSCFYAELLDMLPQIGGAQWQAGNSPYCLAFGKEAWREKFGDTWFHRAFCCFENRAGSVPRFKFGTMLWNRSWSNNWPWFVKHGAEFAEYFERQGFDVGRNQGAGWHRRTRWESPYEMRGLKYANASSPRDVILSDDGCTTWDALLPNVRQHCLGLVEIIDGFSNVR